MSATFLKVSFYCIIIGFKVKFSFSNDTLPLLNDIKIHKCCKFGEYLTSSKLCIAGSSENWAPLIFLMSNKTFYEPRGHFPKTFTIQEDQIPLCENQQFFNKDIVVFSNGSLFISEKKVFITPSNYCIDKDSAIVCTQKNLNSNQKLQQISEQNQLEVKKCCSPRAGYSIKQKSCICFNNTQPNFLKTIGLKRAKVIYGFPICQENYVITPKSQLPIFNKTEEFLNLIKDFQPENFCLERIIEREEHIYEESNNYTNFINIFTCIKPTIKVDKSTWDKVYPIGLLISSFFLLLTLLSGFLVPSNHHRFHWRCQMYYIFCLMIGDLLLGIYRLFSHQIHGLLCKIFGTCMHFFFLSAFFWLNSMCINIWWTFRDFRPASLENNQDLMKLRVISYAWGTPFIITFIGAILDNIEYSASDNFIRPHFDDNLCWFHRDSDIFVYFFGPIGVVLIINMFLFCSTTQQLTCGLWKLEDTKPSAEKTALRKVCLKLVVVMGITWIADVISWIIGGPQHLWHFADIVNTFQGVLIFLVVGCQRVVLTSLKRILTSKSIPWNTTSTNVPHCSFSSHEVSPTVNTPPENVTHLKTSC